jgi:hypothetical protein
LRIQEFYFPANGEDLSEEFSLFTLNSFLIRIICPSISP